MVLEFKEELNKHGVNVKGVKDKLEALLKNQLWTGYLFCLLIQKGKTISRAGINR